MATSDYKGSRILLVDDEEMVRNLLSRALASDGHSITACATKHEALRSMDGGDFDLLIVDKNLPDGSGLSVIEVSRNLGLDPEAIVITGYSDTDSAIEAVALGVFRYVRKPFDLDALRVDISKALETHRLKIALSKRTRELEATNAELVQAMEREKEAENRRIRAERLATIGSLAAGVAHEINNPLALLSMTIPFGIGEVEGMIRDRVVELDPDRATATLEHLLKSLKPTQEAVELLLGLSSDLHSLGRTEPSDPWPVKISDVAGSAARLVRHQLKHKAKLVLDVPEDLTVRGYSKRLVQVFINLLTNAARAVEGGAPDENTVSISAREDDREITVEISDTGRGIPADNLDKIFQRFFSSDGSEGQGQGSGIGLSIVREIMDEHSGRVEVASELGVGTIFSLYFPLPTDRISRMSVPAVARARSDEMTRTRRTILFADSAEGSLEAYEESFGQLHDVFLARTPEEAMELVGQHHEDLDAIVCELGGAGHPMLDLYADVRALDEELGSRFIFLGLQEESRLDELSADIQVLHKPVRPATLLAAVYRLPPRRPSSEISD